MVDVNRSGPCFFNLSGFNSIFLSLRFALRAPFVSIHSFRVLWPIDIHVFSLDIECLQLFLLIFKSFLGLLFRPALLESGESGFVSRLLGRIILDRHLVWVFDDEVFVNDPEPIR